MSEIRNIVRQMKKLEAMMKEYTSDQSSAYELIDPMTELQEKIQETVEIIRTEVKNSRSGGRTDDEVFD